MAVVRFYFDLVLISALKVMLISCLISTVFSENIIGVLSPLINYVV